ncbi:MAG: sugar ABC transporter ATP-binding protein [Lachnospiraceae bacterium]|nr:sugar ABC transporter ATP-binding protein [Lachnospiraceae bacterium]
MQDDKIWFDSISMEFPGVLALDDVSFGVKKGSVHIMMGENGAGKSTLMKVLNGTNIPSKGKFYVDGKEMKFSSSTDAQKHGIAMIYQELSYIPDMTVERYLMLCREPKKGCFIDWKGVSKRAKEILEEEKLDYDPKLTLRQLSISDIQLLEITKCIRSSNVDVLIMDEPTSALTSTEVERLFEKIEMLKKRGITILYISHKMDEIFRIADYITVMRDGKHIRTAPAGEFTNDLLVELMVGREISEVYPKKETPIGDKVLEVEGLTSEYSRLHEVSFYVRAGEILGLGGLMGAGRSETVRAIFGIDKFEKGTIKIDGKPVKIRKVSDAIQNGIALATEDRRRLGLVLCRNLRENISLSSLKKVSRFTFLNLKKEKKLTEQYFQKMKIRAFGLEAEAMTLSGGNQQKAVLSKCLMTDAKVLILDEPTRGIDVGAKHEIYKLMVELAGNGIAIIMISSELPEFIGMCDRAYVMHNGSIVGEVDKEHMTQEEIVRMAAGGGQNGNF